MTGSPTPRSDPAVDARLIDEIRSGSKRSLEALIDKHIPVLMGFFRYLGVPPDMVEDLSQETFERMLKYLGSFDSSRPFTSWLLTIGKNVYFNERAKSTKIRGLAEAAKLDPSTSPDEEVISRESVKDILADLPNDSRVLIELRIFRELPFVEIAQLTGEPESTIRVRFFRIMNRLKVLQGGEKANETRK